MLDINLSKIPLPQDALLCTNTFGKIHSEQINDMHEHIILALLNASNNSIPSLKPLVSKVMPGWNEYVEHYLQSSLLWHDVWKANGQPSESIIADLRCKTRLEYPKVCKMVMRWVEEIKTDKMAEAFLNKHRFFLERSKKNMP